MAVMFPLAFEGVHDKYTITTSATEMIVQGVNRYTIDYIRASGNAIFAYTKNSIEADHCGFLAALQFTFTPK